MTEGSTKRLALKGVTLLLLISGLLLFTRDSTKKLLASSLAAHGQRAEPTVIIETQDGSPLRVVETKVASAEPSDFRLQVFVQNQSDKDIRAYAVASETASAKVQNGYTQFMNLTQRTAIWRPTEIRTIEVSDKQSEPVVSIRLSFDFVEFADGAHWGPDRGNSRDTLAGQRAGAKAEREKIRHLLQKGHGAVTKYLEENSGGEGLTPDKPAPSAEWSEGFRSGVGSVRSRIKRAVQSGPGQVERELAKPFDTSEDN